MSPRTKARNLINSSMRSSSILSLILSILNFVKRGKKSTGVKMLQMRKRAIWNHDLPQISQTRKEINRHRAPHIHHQQILKWPRFNTSQLLILDMISVIYVIIIRSSFLRKRLLCHFISKANASSCPPVDHSGGSHIHLFTKARMTKAPPLKNAWLKRQPWKTVPHPTLPWILWQEILGPSLHWAADEVFSHYIW